LEILLVDDQEEILYFLVSVLETEYQVLLAKNGIEALDVLKNNNVELVVSDVMMPVMDGFELCKHIKTSPEISHIPVILLTAKNTIQSRIEGLEHGADAYIEKPFSPVHLKVQILNLLNSRRKLREYFLRTPLVEVKTVAHTKEDERFSENVSSHIFDQLDNTEFGADDLASAVNMSRITLYRKIKAISNTTPHEFIHITRLKKAAELMVDRRYRVYEIAMMVGYKSQTHFGKVFQKQFGMTPRQFIENANPSRKKQ